MYQSCNKLFELPNIISCHPLTSLPVLCNPHSAGPPKSPARQFESLTFGKNLLQTENPPFTVGLGFTLTQDAPVAPLEPQ